MDVLDVVDGMWNEGVFTVGRCMYSVEGWMSGAGRRMGKDGGAEVMSAGAICSGLSVIVGSAVPA